MRRFECKDGHRPCPLVSCRYNMLWAVSHPHLLARKSNRLLVERLCGLKYSCVLDVTDEYPDGATLEIISKILITNRGKHMTRERVRQLVYGSKHNVGAIDRIKQPARRHVLEAFEYMGEAIHERI